MNVKMATFAVILFAAVASLSFCSLGMDGMFSIVSPDDGEAEFVPWGTDTAQDWPEPQMPESDRDTMGGTFHQSETSPSVPAPAWPSGDDWP